MRVPTSLTENSESSKAWTMEEKAIAFWAKVDRSGGPDACWTWQGAITSKHGYGCFSVGRGVVRGAHKLAWVLTHGDPKGLCICHRCDNRVCVNPAHMFLGTKKDNMEDAVSKGRQVHGEGNIHAILTEAQVREILANPPKRGRGGNVNEYAARYGVTNEAILHIVAKRTWKHLHRETA